MGYWHPAAREQLDCLNKEVIEETERLVKEFEDEGLDHEKIEKVERSQLDINMWRLKIVSDGREVNYRLFLDEVRGQFVYYGIYHRDDAYEVESLLEIMDRQYK